jgi:hypothetical protein
VRRRAAAGPVFRGSPKRERDSPYNSGMITLRAPSGASEQLAHAVELFNRDLDGILANLDTKQQNEFWMNLHGFALAETRGAERNAQLIADDRVNASVREALEMVDEKIAKHVAKLGNRDRERFWQMLHDASEQEQEATKSPKARHGGGSGNQ